MREKDLKSVLIIILGILFINYTSVAQEPDSTDKKDANFGGPDQVDNQLREDKEAKNAFFELRFIQPYFNFKDTLQKKTGFGYGLDYSAVYLSASSSLDHTDAGSGMVRFYASWDLVNRGKLNSGALIFKVENRHKYGAIPPKSLGFEMGYVGMEFPPFSDEKFRLTNFYWRQRFMKGKISLMAGLLDVTDYLDVYALTSPWTGFMNFAFSTGSEIIYLPNDAALGIAFGAYLSKNIYIMSGISDAGSDPKKPWNNFESFFSNHDYLTSVELGWVSSPDRFILDNIHLTYWHSDGSDVTSSLPGWGLAFSATHYFGEKWLPFIRGGFSNDGGTLLQKSLSTGFGFQPEPGGSVLGFGFNWGEPNETTFAKGLKDQYTFELYYRVQLSSKIAITPDVQFLLDPALNPNGSSIFLWGLRGRLAL